MHACGDASAWPGRSRHRPLTCRTLLYVQFQARVADPSSSRSGLPTKKPLVAVAVCCLVIAPETGAGRKLDSRLSAGRTVRPDPGAHWPASCRPPTQSSSADCACAGTPDWSSLHCHDRTLNMCDQRPVVAEVRVMDERGLEPFASGRRNLIKGGLLAAAVAPWAAGSSATAASHAMYPRIGQRVLAVDDRVIGVGACHTSARVGEPSTGFQPVDYSDMLILRLLQVSLLNGDGDPRTVRVNDDDNMRLALDTVLNEEARTINVVRESSLFWVQANPVFLYAVGAGVSICLFPFVQGFFNQLGSRAADWLWERVVER